MERKEWRYEVEQSLVRERGFPKRGKRAPRLARLGPASWDPALALRLQWFARDGRRGASALWRLGYTCLQAGRLRCPTALGRFLSRKSRRRFPE